MKTFTLLSGAVLVAGLTVSSLANAQDSNGLDVPAPAPDLIAPLSNAVVSNANPTFEFEVVSNATQYRLLVVNNATGQRFFYRFDSTGNDVVDSSGQVVCPSATIADTPCSFTPTNLNFADGTTFRWLVGARNTAADQVKFSNSAAQNPVTFDQNGAPAAALTDDELYAPRGNITNDSGDTRLSPTGAIAFHWKNNNDATRFVLKLATAVGNNVIPSVTIDLADASCTTTSGLFDACVAFVDPELLVDFSASDFCWTIVPLAGTQTAGPDAIDLANDPFACFASL